MRPRYISSLVTSLMALSVSVTALPALATTDQTAASSAHASDRRIHLARWDTAKHWQTGSRAGVRIADGRLEIANRVAKREYAGRTYGVSHWTSPWRKPGFGLTQLIASWSATTPGDSWIEISARGRRDDAQTSWDVLARWTGGDRYTKRRTWSGQTDDGTRVNVDTWLASPSLSRYQLRVTLLRRVGSDARPKVDFATAMSSRVPGAAGRTSRPGVARGKVLSVPRYSQMRHRGHYPKWGNGGEAWCSPTSVSMVLGYYDHLPAAREYAWIASDHAEPWVDLAARRTYDYSYNGTGNWPFNTAFASRYTGKAFVTRLRSLREAEIFIAAGIPVVASIAFSEGELTGAPIRSSDGHLLVISGFRSNGDVVVNDPAASTRDGVRRTYRRGQFERLWMDASGGLAYVIHDRSHPLPDPSRHSNW